MDDLRESPVRNANGRRKLRALPEPEPVAGLDAYQRERELALAALPEKKANYERYQQSGHNSAELDYLPVKLDIENVSRCNFRCTMCVVSEWDKGKRADDLPLDAFKRLIDQQTGLVEIKLQGIGEPLMQGDDVFEMIRYARGRHIWVRTTTNASLLHLHDNHRKLIDSGVNEVQISIDGADEAVFTAIRRGAQFEQVLSNCKLINGYCKEKGVKRTKMWTVVQKANAHQTEALVDLAAELGFESMVFALNLSDWGLEEWNARNAAVSMENALDPDDLLPLVELGERQGVTVRFWNVNEKYELGAPDTLCPWPFERAYVSSDLRVVPCCYVGNPDVFELAGDAGDFTAAWHDAAYADFRKAHLEGKLPNICKGCYRNSEPAAGDSS